MMEMTAEEIEKRDEEIIQQEFEGLLNDYLSSNHRKKVEKITKAFNFANNAHKGVKRRSGEPYIMHPLAVSRIVSKEIGMGSTSICAALLHDVVEDTNFTVEDIENEFGEKIASIVDGLTKISGGIFGDQASKQAENFKHLLLTMSEDIRVILIKIADRLHNMRTLGSMLPNKQYKIAGETLYIYAPLSHRLGLYAIKTELEDLSFKYEHPAIYAEIQQKLSQTEQNRNELYTNFITPIEEKLKKTSIDFKLDARVKSVYSIWEKMQNKKVPFEEIYDILAVRITFGSEGNSSDKDICWDIYSLITDIYQVHPDRTRDWVSTPKANGYQALHITVMGPKGQWIEVQIRSKRMDDIAEKGVAAHWKYKERCADSSSEIETKKENELDKWIETIREILENPEPNAIDFLDTIKLNLFASEIFVFTPKGDIKTLPHGATALDFAFSLHEDLGTHCIGAKVNHKLVPLSHKLEGGDQVEIITSKVQSPQPEWLNFVTTAKARAKIRLFLRKERRTTINAGEKLLQEYMEEHSITKTDEIINSVIQNLKLDNKEELFYKIGEGEIRLDAKMESLMKEQGKNRFSRYLKRFSIGNKSDKTQDEPQNQLLDRKIDPKKTYLLTDDNNTKNYILALCCNPIPGDEVLGIIDPNGQVIVHRRDCPEALKIKSSFGDRLLSVEWPSTTSSSFAANIEIKGFDSGVGVLHQITQIISEDQSVNILKVMFESNDGMFTGKLKLVVQNVDDISTLCNKLQELSNVQSVIRVEK
ncbi:MAG: RelA/SpoT family protein [Bacteroidales bacterium]|nr:RelA/SpoT family protein [Bacteroidales bacterium]MDD4822966.1 RelA/SpoT family protein [Bacteroidales bacterium]